ncbi:MAG TPA: TVP38/TMEM64 family protein [Candidatus Nanoarchaeia archaeon]|nr:TVP38/TMEM64 family protein [Candidatus Nanoarchaeia archaeon]
MLRHVFTTPKARMKFWIAVIAIIVFLVGLFLFIKKEFPFLLSPIQLKEFVIGYGSLAPLVFILIQALQVLIAPIPGQVLTFASGFIFGAVNGIAFSIVGVMIGSIIAFSLAKRFGRPFVERAIDRETLKRFDGMMQRKGPIALFLIYLLPALPDDALCFIAGLTRMRIGQFAFIAFIGRLPGFIVLGMAGDGVADGHLLFTFILFSVFMAISFFIYLYRDYVHRVIKKSTE